MARSHPAGIARKRVLRTIVTATAAASLAAAGLAAAGSATAATPYTPTKLSIPSEGGEVAFSPNGQTAYAAEYNSAAVAVVDTATGAITKTIPVSDYPGGVAVSPDGSTLYVTIDGNDTLAEISTATDTVTKTVAVGHAPYSVAFTPNGQEAYVTNLGNGTADGSASVVDTATGDVTATIPLGPNPQSIAFTPNGDEAIIAVPGAVTTSTANPDPGQISVIDVATNTVAANITVGATPDSVAITADGARALVSNWYDDTVSDVNLSTQQVTATIPVGPGPNAVGLSPDGQLYVANQGDTDSDGSVSVVDTATDQVVNTVSIGGNPESLSISPDGSEVYVGNLDPYVSVIDTAMLDWNPSTTRISGADRYATSVAVAQASYPGTAPVAFVATGLNFPDALSAASIAAKDGGPLLLTAPTSLTPSVATELSSLKPATIYIAGGTGAVSQAVQNSLVDLAKGWSGTVVRKAGSDRYGTSQALVGSAFTSAPTVFIATGADFPDALSASAAAGAQGMPVILVNGSATSLNAQTISFLKGLGTTKFLIAGGTGAVSAGIASQLGDLGTVTRYAGSDRYATSELINKAAFPTPSQAFYATGMQYPDALSGAVMAAKAGAPLYVVEPTCVPEQTESDLVSAGTGQVTLIGGTGALSSAVQSQANCG